MDIRKFLKGGNRGKKPAASGSASGTPTSRNAASSAADDVRDKKPRPSSSRRSTSKAKPSTSAEKLPSARKRPRESAAAAAAAAVPAEEDHPAEEAPPPEKKKARWVPRTDDPPNRGNKPLPIGSSDCLAGKVFVISGVLDSLLREECQDLCRQYGGRVVSGVSKRVTHGVIGIEPGASKLTKLKANGTPLISEDDLFAMINATKSLAIMKDEDSDPMKVEDEVELISVERPATDSSSKRASTSAKSPRSKGKPASKAANAKGGKSSAHSPSLWVDKYKPTGSADLVANKKVLVDLRDWLDNWKSKFLRGDGHAMKLKDRRDSDYPAALLLGPPGIGKTSAAHIVCREAGFEPHEFNASDVRNKAGVQMLAETVMVANTMTKYLSFSKSAKRGSDTYPNGQVLIMDEVDGMSGGDRGGSQELLRMIKKSKVPVICIANDETTANMRTMASNCYRLRFRRPMVSQVTKRLAEIARREGFHALQDQTLFKLAEGCNGDIRQMINLLQTWRVASPSLSFMQVKERLDVEGKTVMQKSTFELARTFFMPGGDGSVNSLAARTENYFADSDLMPLFVQENYISTVAGSQCLETLADAAESIAEGDLCNTMVRREQRWELMPACAVMSAIRPGSMLGGGLGASPMFPSFLGNMSKGNKWKRVVQGLEMKVKAVQTTTGSNCAFRLDYIPALTTCLATPLIRNGAGGIAEVVERLDAYYLERDPDWLEILDAGVFVKGRSPMENIPGPVKSAFTREYNSGVHARSTVTGMRVGVKGVDGPVVTSSRKAEKEAIGVVDDDEDGEIEEEDVSDEEDALKEFGAKKGRGGRGGKGKRGGSGGRSSAGGSRSKGSSSGSRSAGKGKGRGKARKSR